MANFLSQEGCGEDIGADEYFRKRTRHCKDRKESKMGQSVTNSAWGGEGWGTGGSL